MSTRDRLDLRRRLLEIVGLRHPQDAVDAILAEFNVLTEAERASLHDAGAERGRALGRAEVVAAVQAEFRKVALAHDPDEEMSDDAAEVANAVFHALARFTEGGGDDGNR